MPTCLSIRSAFRALRSLRVIQGVPSLQRVLNSILRALPQLASVGVVSMSIVVLYAIVGGEFFRGSLNSACFYNATGEAVEPRRPCVTTGPGHRCEGNGCVTQFTRLTD